MLGPLSQDYNVDSRYRGMRRARDNEAGKMFVKSYLQKQESAGKQNITESRKMDNRVIVSGPGDSTYSFKNPFRASK